MEDGWRLCDGWQGHAGPVALEEGGKASRQRVVGKRGVWPEDRL